MSQNSRFKIPAVVRKAGILIAGSAVIIVGVALLVLPGPGIVVIIAGLFILSLEFEWAERYLAWAKAKAAQAAKKARGK